jgi:peptidoglycan/xylan/chitin deacetylase (PgdA/CDA1 family)
MYHRIAKEAFDPWGLAVAPATFREQLAWISANRIVLSLAEFAARHLDRSLPANAVALTFDDGYACTAEIAAPLLEEFGLHATIFVPPELIERGGPFWWDELAEIVLNHDQSHMTINGEAVVVGPRDPRDSEWKPWADPKTPRQRAFHRIWSALRPMTPTVQNNTMDALRGQFTKSLTSTPRPMSPAQVRAIASDCIEIGSHALTHPWLSSLTSRDKVREIHESIERCEKLSGERAKSFAYPYGHFDQESEQIVSKSGFSYACASMGTPVAPDSRRFALPRFQVGNWAVRRLSRRLGY